MTNNNTTEFFNDQLIKSKVLEIWTKVFSDSNKVIHHHRIHSFEGMDLIDPTIDKMVDLLRMQEDILQVLYEGSEILGIEYDEVRMILNAKEQISRMERVASAYKAKNRDDFDRAMTALEQQAAF